jgi:predicted TIM-barrel fold metal-dependent hydrolase
LVAPLRARRAFGASLCALVVLLVAAALGSGCKRLKLPVGDAGAGGATASSYPPNGNGMALIDSHVHITPLSEPFNLALRIFSRVGVERFAVKSAGGPGEPRYAVTRKLARELGERMAFFTNIDWDDIDDPGWGKREADRLERAMREGASGIKIFKALGLGVRLADGKLMRVDDPRLEPIWARAAASGAIVAWHIADPVAFFKPIDEKNERYDELKLAPEWSFYGKDYPSYAELMRLFEKVVCGHPKTTFVGIHLASYPEDLAAAARLLDRCPNLWVDVSARVPEIGRHPADEGRRFFVKYQDRVLFGTDLIVGTNGMQLGSISEKPPGFEDALRYYADHRRYFETADRQIAHPTPIQGRWKIDAVNLPRPVLKKIYYDNADRLIFAPRRAWLKAHPDE